MIRVFRCRDPSDVLASCDTRLRRPMTHALTSCDLFDVLTSCDLTSRLWATSRRGVTHVLAAQGCALTRPSHANFFSFFLFILSRCWWRLQAGTGVVVQWIDPQHGHSMVAVVIAQIELWLQWWLSCSCVLVQSTRTGSPQDQIILRVVRSCRAQDKESSYLTLFF